MKLLEDIIEETVSEQGSVSPLLRKCLLLAYRLKNTPLRVWVEQELKGYPDKKDLPDYRRATGVAKGTFSGPLGSAITNRPLPATALKPEHQHFALEITLAQPIAAYEDYKKDEVYQMPWPADLTALYQSSFIQGYSLSAAWMPIPGSMMRALIDAIRTRVLTFALEIQAELPFDDETSVERIPPKTVDRLVQVTIYGGNVVLGDVQALNAPTVIAGDRASLATILTGLGLDDGDLASLDASLQDDGSITSKGEAKRSVGKKTMEWITKAAKKVGGGTLAVSGAVAEEAVKRAVFGYLGL